MSSQFVSITKESFMLIDVENTNPVAEFKDLMLEKNKRIYEIRMKSKRLWLKLPPVMLRYGFKTNSFKPGITTEGSVVMVLNNHLHQYIETVDNRIFENFDKLFRGTVLNNMMMTKNAVQKMCKSSIWNGALKLTVSSESTVFFNENRETIEGTVGLTKLKEGTICSMVIEPSFAWIMNGTIGIRWDARQVRFGGTLPETDSTDYSEEEIDSGISSLNKTQKKGFSLLKDDTDSEEESPKQKSKGKEPAKSITKGFSLLDSSSSSDEGDVRTRKTGPSKIALKSTKPVIAPKKWRLAPDSSDSD